MANIDYLAKIRSIAKTLKMLIKNGAKIPKPRYMSFLELLEHTYIKSRTPEVRKELTELMEYFKKHDHIAKIMHEFKSYAHRLGVYCSEVVQPIIKGEHVKFNLSGYRYHRMIPELLKSLNDFINSSEIKVPNKITDLIIDGLQDAQFALREENLTDATKRYMDRYNQDKPVILATGWSGHAVCMVIYKNKLVICNKGQGSEKGISSQIFEIGDKDKFTDKVMSRLLNAQHHGYFSYFKANTTQYYMLRELKNVLGLKRVDSIKGVNQKEGICVQSSLKTAVKTTLKFLIDEENEKNKDTENYKAIDSIKYYKGWAKYDRKISFDRILNLYKDKNINKDALDEMLIRTAFSQNDPNKPNEIARFNKILEIVDLQKNLPLISNLLWQEKIVNSIFPENAKKLEVMERGVKQAKLKLKSADLITLNSKNPLYPLALNNQMLNSIKTKNYDAIEKLLLLGSKSNFFQTKILNTSWGPLHYAIANKDEKAIKIFIKNGIDTRSYPGVSLLRLASYLGAKEIFWLLLMSARNFGTGEFLRAKDDNGHTLLHTAISNKQTEMAKMLIENGANVQDKTNLGHTALELAKISGCGKEIEEIIKNYNNIKERKNIDSKNTLSKSSITYLYNSKSNQQFQDNKHNDKAIYKKSFKSNKVIA